MYSLKSSGQRHNPSYKGHLQSVAAAIAYHRAINRRQQLNAKHFYNLASIEDAERATSIKQLNFGRLTQCEVKQLMRQSLAKLNSAQKRVIELATYQGLSMQEISAQTGESVTNVRHHYYRGLKNLRSFIYDTRITLRGVDVGAA